MSRALLMGVMAVIAMGVTGLSDRTQAAPPRQRVEFKSGPERLAGTVFRPDTTVDVPGVVILGGSERGPRTAMKERLAAHFAATGVAALVYDSPGTGRSTGNALLQTRDARANEALAAVRCLGEQHGVLPDQVGILGISEGALITLLAAARDHSVAFAIPVSGSFGIPMMDAARYRIEVTGLAGGVGPDELQKAVLLEELLFALMAGPEPFEWRLIEMKAAQWPDEPWDELIDVTRNARKAASAAERETALSTLRRVLLTWRAAPWFESVVVDVERFDRMLALGADRFFAFLEDNPLARGDFDKVSEERAQYSKLRCPVLAVWGERDDYLPPHRSAAFLGRCLDSAGHGDWTFVIVPGATHIITRGEDDAEFAAPYPAVLTDWLARLFDVPEGP